MNKKEALDLIRDIKSKAVEQIAAPDTYWQHVSVNYDIDYITVPSAGTLWINLTVGGAPPTIIELVRSDGSSTPILPGDNTFIVVAGDSILLTNVPSNSLYYVIMNFSLT